MVTMMSDSVSFFVVSVAVVVDDYSWDCQSMLLLLMMMTMNAYSISILRTVETVETAESLQANHLLVHSLQHHAPMSSLNYLS